MLLLCVPLCGEGSSFLPTCPTQIPVFILVLLLRTGLTRGTASAGGELASSITQNRQSPALIQSNRVAASRQILHPLIDGRPLHWCNHQPCSQSSLCPCGTGIVVSTPSQPLMFAIVQFVSSFHGLHVRQPPQSRSTLQQKHRTPTEKSSRLFRLSKEELAEETPVRPGLPRRLFILGLTRVVPILAVEV